MVIKQKIGQKVFLEQKTYYIYNSEIDWEEGRPSVITSNENEFNAIMERDKEIIEAPVVTLSSDKERLTLHNYQIVGGRVTVNKYEAMLLMLELYKFINPEEK